MPVQFTHQRLFLLRRPGQLRIKDMAAFVLRFFINDGVALCDSRVCKGVIWVRIRVRTGARVRLFARMDLENVLDCHFGPLAVKSSTFILWNCICKCIYTECDLISQFAKMIVYRS